MPKNKKRKILLVDDEVDFRELFTVRLQANNYDVITAIDGEDALEKIKKEVPDAVLLDILMPRIDGIEVLRRIREQYPSLPVFIVTAFSNEERFRSANKYNASGFILKTSNLQGEIDKINETIDIAERYKR